MPLYQMLPTIRVCMCACLSLLTSYGYVLCAMPFFRMASTCVFVAYTIIIHHYTLARIGKKTSLVWREKENKMKIRIRITNQVLERKVCCYEYCQYWKSNTFSEFVTSKFGLTNFNRGYFTLSFCKIIGFGDLNKKAKVRMC